MTSRRLGAAALASLVLWTGQTQTRQTERAQADSRASLANAIEPVIDVLWKTYDPATAMDHVRFISRYWRLPGNPGYNASIDRIRERLAGAGLSPTIEEYPNSGPAWDHSIGTLALVHDGEPDQIVLSREKDGLALCINSFSTPAEGVMARLVDVGRGREEDFAATDVKGAVVLGDAEAGQLWRLAVVTGGAIGVISTALPSYLNADPPGAPATPRETWDILQWSSVPYDAARKGFGFKASPRAAAALRARLAAAPASAPVSVRVTISSSFTMGPVRTLVAEIPGRSAPAERVVLAAHVQEPGANDNASGVATLAELAVSMASAVRQKKIAAPERTITFLFLAEISGSRRWLQDHANAARQVRYMFSLDMTGEDVKKTGGSFLVERYPDPGAVWERPWDPHSEWGRGNVRPESLKGDLINDAHLFVAERVARRTGWIVKTNPYEGGSDHTVFGQAGVPSVLDWHFTDRYYHTNFDTPDKTSPEEMRNVGVAAGASAWLLASATPAMATNVAEVVAAAGRERIAAEISGGAKIAAEAADPAAARTRESTIVAAWKKWYAEAVRSASRLVVGAAPAAFTAELDRIAATFGADPPRSSPMSLFGGLPAPLFKTTAAPHRPNQEIDPNAIFICGEDQKLPAEIPLRWSTIVLAGDGRFYQPCPNQPNGMRADHTREHREVREAAVVRAGLRSFDSENQWRAAQAQARSPRLPSIVVNVQAGAGRVTPGTMVAVAYVLNDILGGFVGSTVTPACSSEIQVFSPFGETRRWQPGLLFDMLIGRNRGVPNVTSPSAPAQSVVAVQKEAAYAIGARLADPELSADLVTAATKETRSCLLQPFVPEVQGLLLEALGVARYSTDAQRGEAEALLVKESQGAPLKILGAVKGLEALIRQNPQHPVSDDTRGRLRQLAIYGIRSTEAPVLDIDARIRRLALMALQAARDTDTATLRNAVADGDWQVRRLAAGRLNLSDPEQAALGEQLENDTAFQVRYDLLSPMSRLATRTGSCAPIVRRFSDPSPLVVMRAMDVLPATCSDLDDAVVKLTAAADKLARIEEAAGWHIPSRALTALARVKPELARARLDSAAQHQVWQVRAAVAAASATLEDEATAARLAKDPEPNVQTAALDALFRMRSAAVATHAIDVLKTGEDYQLLRMAAFVLKGVPEASRDAANEALLGALRRLTDQQTDTSRDPRVAIIERLGETLPVGLSNELLPFTTDFDDEVIATAVKSFQTIVGSAPSESPKRRRYPFQPPELDLHSLPGVAIIQLEEGPVYLRLLADVAPVTVARFAMLVRSGFYKDRTFHRVVPNFVVQGGSPGANEYAGTTRYMRDEVGPQAAHVRGAVGISTRGRDTGDGQIFIDLVDLPRLDRDYTVFAYVTTGMEFVDRLLEGGKIINITLK